MQKEAIKDFLEAQGHLAEQVDIDEESKRFQEHLEKGLAGVKLPDAMPMIPTYLSVGAKAEANKPVIVMDAGGTNFRICLLTFNENMEATVERFERFPMPGTEGEISKEEFFNAFAEKVEPYLEFSQTIGFCFSYACEIQENYDGKMLKFSKEVKCPEAEGSFIGASLKEALRKRGYEQIDDIHIVLLNDTVAALMGGYAKSNTREYMGYAGLILGTGINIAYVEDNEKIKKLDGKLGEGNTIINTEAGDYRIALESLVDKAVDDASDAPGTYAMEKKISGRYQGLQAYYLIMHAVDETDLFSDAFRTKYKKLQKLDSEDLSAFVENPYGHNDLSFCCETEEDRNTVYYLLDNIFDRAARLVCAIFAGVFMELDKEVTPTKPLAVTVEGTTYYKSERFRHHLNYYVKSYLNAKGYYMDFLQVDNANLIGSAIAALVNH